MFEVFVILVKDHIIVEIFFTKISAMLRVECNYAIALALTQDDKLNIPYFHFIDRYSF